MIIYSNQSCPIEIEDLANDIYYDSYIYTPDGIYKKYKYHFYEITTNENLTNYMFDNVDYFVQENEYKIDKSKIITTIPYKHYFVNQKKIKAQLTDNLILVKEIDNDYYSREYFITELPIFDAFNQISLFYNNKLFI